MRRILSKLALLVLLTSWQASPAEDLVAIYGLALENDAELQIAEANYLAAVQQLPFAESSRKPQITFNADGTNTDTDNSDLGDNENTTLGSSLNLSQSLYDNEVSGNIDVAEANVEAALADLQSTRQALIIRVSETYFGILAAQDNVEFAYAERTAIERQLEQAQKRFEVGLIAITDVHEAQARYDAADAAVILAENILDNAFQALIVITGQPSIDTLTPLGEKLDLAFPIPADAESWVATALENNRDLLAAQHSLRAARSERDKNARGRLPDPRPGRQLRVPGHRRRHPGRLEPG